MTGPVEKGLQRVAWDLRAPAHQLPPNRPRGELEELFGDPLVGPFVVPGKYSVTLSQRVGGVVPARWAARSRSTSCSIRRSVIRRPTSTARWQFEQKLQTLRRDIAGSLELANSTATRLDAILQGARRDACRAAAAARSGARAQETAGGDPRGAAGRSRARIAQRADAGGDLRARQHHQRRVESTRSAGRRRRTSSSCRSRRSCSRRSARR